MSADTLTANTIAPVSPVIVRSPVAAPTASKAEIVSPASPTKEVEAEDEAQPQRLFSDRKGKHIVPCLYNDKTYSIIVPFTYNADLVFRPKPSNGCSTWVVYCNACNKPMEDVHYHCGVCDGGDYDLCPSCVDSGIHCPGSGHWMVKRFVKNGCVVNSTTQRIPPKVKAEENQEVPGAYAEEKQSIANEEEPTRTCNCCVKVLPEEEFVTCDACDDYDLCMECHISNKHGHHPGHVFSAATSETVLSGLADFLCKSGRNVRHSAVCDGCDKFIYGVRHKCLNCPDWDYCSDCVKSAKHIHPRHRFVPIYEPLAEPLNSGNRHYGIYCDGPLCKDRENLSYIEGIRYKCAVCHDTDFCQNCEAHPSNRHNHTHPLIKFKTPVRSVSVTTVNDDKTGRSLARLGDRQPPQRSTATETTPVASSTNAATEVQTIVDLKPSDEPQIKKEKIAIRDLLIDATEPAQEKESVPVEEKPVPEAAPSWTPAESKNGGFDAHFVRDTIVDGSNMVAGAQFVQVWTLRNPGPTAWPAGCSVRHVGGDNMLNIDNNRPLSQAELANASESNVIGRPVEAGEEVFFRVIMKAPQREGTAISYWRLKTADGLPFGHRLWCDINVVAAQDQAPAWCSMERQKMEHIQQVRNAAVQLLMDRGRREHMSRAEIVKPYQTGPNAEKSAIQPTTELPAEEKPSKSAPEPMACGMVFPQLDKESPESSTYEAPTAVEHQSPVSEKSTIARTVTVASDDEFFEDAESVALHSDDEGFMTDEEYDILDASDEEMP